MGLWPWKHIIRAKHCKSNHSLGFRPQRLSKNLWRDSSTRPRAGDQINIALDTAMDPDRIAELFSLGS
jgi:hypothetical protein